MPWRASCRFFEHSPAILGLGERETAESITLWALQMQENESSFVASAVRQPGCDSDLESPRHPRISHKSLKSPDMSLP